MRYMNLQFHKSKKSSIVSSERKAASKIYNSMDYGSMEANAGKDQPRETVYSTAKEERVLIDTSN